MNKQLNYRKEAAILFLLRDNQLVALGLAEEKATYKEVSFDHSILLKPTWDTELAYLAQAFLDDAKESGLTLEATPATVKIPKSAVATVTNYKETVTFILERFGYSLFKTGAEESQTSQSTPQMDKRSQPNSFLY